VGKVCNLCRVKTDISAVLTVKSGSDPHMFNLMEITMVNSVVFLFQYIYLLQFYYFFYKCGLVHTCLVNSY